MSCWILQLGTWDAQDDSVMKRDLAADLAGFLGLMFILRMVGPDNPDSTVSRLQWPRVVFAVALLLVAVVSPSEATRPEVARMSACMCLGIYRGMGVPMCTDKCMGMHMRMFTIVSERVCSV